MKTFYLEQDVKVLCVTAVTFPQGVEGAYVSLEKAVDSKGRTLYGLSKPNNGQIVYKAAVTESFDGESESTGLESYTIAKGEYSTETIYNWRNNMQQFAPTFMALLDNPRLDHNSWCIEWYKGDDVLCMVKLQDH